MPDGFKKFVIHNVKVSYDYLVIWFYIYVSVCSGKLNSQTLNFFEPPDPDSSNQWLLPPSQIQ